MYAYYISATLQCQRFVKSLLRNRRPNAKTVSRHVTSIIGPIPTIPPHPKFFSPHVHTLPAHFALHMPPQSPCGTAAKSPGTLSPGCDWARPGYMFIQHRRCPFPPQISRLMLSSASSSPSGRRPTVPRTHHRLHLVSSYRLPQDRLRTRRSACQANHRLTERLRQPDNLTAAGLPPTISQRSRAWSFNDRPVQQAILRDAPAPPGQLQQPGTLKRR